MTAKKSEITYNKKAKEWEYFDDDTFIVIPVKQFRFFGKKRAYKEIKAEVDAHLDTLQYTKQLERCPFCGNPATMERDKDGWYRAKCNECFVGQQWHPDPMLQVESWNRRTFAIPFTNGWKYKTAEERTEAFLPFCKENRKCKGGFENCCKCQFDWLEQEADDEKISEHED